jgi:hypothetical protein
LLIDVIAQLFVLRFSAFFQVLQTVEVVKTNNRLEGCSPHYCMRASLRTSSLNLRR